MGGGGSFSDCLPYRGAWGLSLGPGTCNTLGMTVKIVSHVDFTVRTRGTQSRRESLGLRS